MMLAKNISDVIVLLSVSKLFIISFIDNESFLLRSVFWNIFSIKPSMLLEFDLDKEFINLIII